MSKPNSAATSLLTEHLRYTPLSLIDDIINAMNALIYHAVSSVENGLLSTPPEVLGFGKNNDTGTVDSIPDTDGDGNVVYPEAKLEIENGVHQLETLLESAVDKDFDKLEIYSLRSILSVPDELVPWVRLAHYENLSFNPPSADSDGPTPESINLQRRKLRETQKLHAALARERDQNAALIEQLRALRSGALPPSTSTLPSSTSSSKLKTEPQSDSEKQIPADSNDAQAFQNTLSPFSFLFNAPSAQSLGVGAASSTSSSSSFPSTNTSIPLSSARQSIGPSSTAPSTSASASASSRPLPLTTNAEFLISQLSALRTALDALRPRLASLPAVPAAHLDRDADAHPTSRTARTQYIESQTRRHMERTRRLELTSQGAIRHGEWQQPGRKIFMDEVHALESVVGQLKESAEHEHGALNSSSGALNTIPAEAAEPAEPAEQETETRPGTDTRTGTGSKSPNVEMPDATDR